MATRTNIKSSTCQTFVCGQKVDDATMNTLSDAAVSAMYRGETVVNQTGIRPPDRTQALLNGYWEGDNIVFPSKEVGWDYENAGYDKWLILMSYKFFVGTGVTRIAIVHTDKNGSTSTLWDSSTASPAPTANTQNSLTISGTFSNPPTSGNAEKESIGVIVYTEFATTQAYGYVAYGGWSGVINFSMKLYSECS